MVAAAEADNTGPVPDNGMCLPLPHNPPCNVITFANCHTDRLLAGSVRPSPAPSASRTRLACGRTAAWRTQGGSSSSGSSGSDGGTSGGRRTRASARSRLATSPGGCSKPQHSIPRAVQSQRLLPAQLQLQGICAVHSQAQVQPPAAVAVARLAAHLRRTQVLSGLVTALLQAPSAPAVRCAAASLGV